MTDNNNFYGDNIRFGIGTVEDVDDPLQAGRVRVRIYGIHSPFLADLPVNDLPWSQVLMPSTTASVHGIGGTPDLVVGSRVMGFFLDGDNYQQFLVVGSLPGISAVTTAQLNNDPGVERSPAILVGDSNPEKAFHFFVQYAAYSEDQAAGIVGALAYDSTTNLNTTGQGIANWSEDDYDRLREFTSQITNDVDGPEKLETQLAFLLVDLQTSFVTTGKALANALQAPDSAKIFTEGYLKRGNITARQTLAQQALAAYGTKGGDDTGSFPDASATINDYSKGTIIETGEELLSMLKRAKRSRSILELVVDDTRTYEDENITVFDLEKRAIDAGLPSLEHHFLIRRDGSLQIGLDIGLKEPTSSTTTVDEHATTSSETGKQLIRDLEGLRLEAYVDGAGFAIGYGHNNLTEPVTQEGDVITTAEAESLLKQDTDFLAREILTQLDGIPINQNQLDAYISFAYNIGLGAFASSTSLRRFKRGDIRGAGDAMLRFNKVTETRNGKRVRVVNDGLVSRRRRERNLFLATSSAEDQVTVQRRDSSIAIALAGGLAGNIVARNEKRKRNFTQKQMDVLDEFIESFLYVWKDSAVLGRRDIDSLSDAPLFDVPAHVKSKFDHDNPEPRTANQQSANKFERPIVDDSVVEEPSSTTPVVVEEATPDEEVEVVQETGTSTTTFPGILIDLTPYVLISNFANLLANRSINDLSDVTGTPANGQVLVYNSTTQRYEPGDQTGSGSGLYDTGDAITAIATDDFLSFIDSSDSNNPKRRGVSDFLTDLNVVLSGANLSVLTNDSGFITASSTDTLTNKSGSNSQWTNDENYIAVGGNVSDLVNDAGYVTSAGSGTVTSVAISATDGIEVDSGSPITTSGTITISLDSATQTSLGLADSALQSGDNISLLTNNAGYVTASSTTEFTNKSGAISQWTNDSGYTTNTGTVTSVAITALDGIEVDSGSPITGSGTITISLDSATQTSLSLADSALQSGDNISELTNDSGFITASSTDTLTNKSGAISQWTNDAGYITAVDAEVVQDTVGAMVTGNTEALITVSYEDTDGTLDFVVNDDLSLYDNTNSNFVTVSNLVEEIQDQIANMVTGGVETLISVTYNDSLEVLNFVVEDDLSQYDNSTTNFITASGAQTLTNKSGAISQWTNDENYVSAGDNVSDLTNDANYTSTGDNISVFTNNANYVASGANLSVFVNDPGYLTISTLTANSTYIESVQDIVGGMLSGNTETLITVTYDDSLEKLNFVVDNDLSNYDNATSAFITASSTDTLTNKSGSNSQWTNDENYVSSGANISVFNNDAGYITGGSFYSTPEEIEDIVGAMVTGNAESLISVTYDDASDKLNFVVDQNLDNYNNSVANFYSLNDNFALSNAKLAQVSPNTIKGRISSGAGAVEDLDPDEVRTIISSRETLQADRTYYVSATGGSDSNDGLSTGTRFATIQHALDVAGSLDFGLFDVTISLETGTHSEPTLFFPDVIGSGTLKVVGEGASPGDTIMQLANTSLGVVVIHASQVAGKYEIDNVRLDANNTLFGIGGYTGAATINIGDIEVTRIARAVFFCQYPATFFINGPVRWTGGTASVNYIVEAQQGGRIVWNSAVSPDFIMDTGTLTFAVACGLAGAGGIINVGGFTSSGTFSGNKGNASENGICRGCTSFPGSGTSAVSGGIVT